MMGTGNASIAATASLFIVMQLVPQDALPNIVRPASLGRANILSSPTRVWKLQKAMLVDSAF